MTEREWARKDCKKEALISEEEKGKRKEKKRWSRVEWSC